MTTTGKVQHHLTALYILHCACVSHSQLVPQQVLKPLVTTAGIPWQLNFQQLWQCDTSRDNITAYPCNLVDNMADVWQFDFVPLKLREKARLLLHDLCFNVWLFVQQQVLTGTAMAHFACLSSLRHVAVAIGCAAFLSEVDDCYAPDNLIGTWLNGAKICTFLCNPSKVFCLQSSICTGVNA